MNNRLTASKTSQRRQQAVKLNKTNTDSDAHFLFPLSLPLLYALNIGSDSCSVLLSVYRALEKIPTHTHM